MFVSASQISVLCAWRRCGCVFQETSNNSEEQCDMQSSKVNVWGKIFRTFIWRICQSSLTASMTIDVVWQETPWIYNKINVFYLTSFSKSAKNFTAFIQGVYLTFEAVDTNVGILPLNLIEFCCLKRQLVRHNLQLTTISGQFQIFRAWNWMQLQMSAMCTFRERIWPYSSRPESLHTAVGTGTSLWTGRSSIYCW